MTTHAPVLDYRLLQIRAERRAGLIDADVGRAAEAIISRAIRFCDEGRIPGTKALDISGRAMSMAHDFPVEMEDRHEPR
ncbi:hypothetical protein [Methylobacterium sp. WL19]|uniref:hypothetical protein n=1 Tax=Methylobacterium sp. WL19 TaxID=2603896 RepID=UPI0011CA2E49|nr:hypothetical protein [Methylobacterium sp. WL19]TXN33506.1 hypothetical protein FV220_01845 [Methylobacterium sp. WL19]